MRQVWFGFAAAAAIVGSLDSQVVGMQGTTATAAWRMVPALATICTSNDDFIEKLDAAGVSLNAEIERQKEVNAVVRERFDNMNMSEKAQKMQAFMMKNPQAAAKMLGGEQAAGAAAQTAVTEANEASKRLDTELEALRTAFRAAADQAVEPIRAKQKALIDAKTVAVGEAAISMFTNAADHAQYVKLIAEENAAYERACQPYFGAAGSFHKWVASYRAEVVDRMITTGEAGEAAMVMQIQAMDLPGDGFRPTAAFEQVNSFLPRLRTVWGFRPSKALAVVELRK